MSSDRPRLISGPWDAIAFGLVLLIVAGILEIGRLLIVGFFAAFS